MNKHNIDNLMMTITMITTQAHKHEHIVTHKSIHSSHTNFLTIPTAKIAKPPNFNFHCQLPELLCSLVSISWFLLLIINFQPWPSILLPQHWHPKIRVQTIWCEFNILVAILETFVIFSLFGDILPTTEKLANKIRINRIAGNLCDPNVG